MESLLITDLVRYGHVLTVAIGIGGSFFADFTVLRNLRHKVSLDLLATLHLAHLVVTFALIGMWATGLAMVYLRTGFDVAQFSPKLYTKLAVVSVLTINAIMIGVVAMPIVRMTLGHKLLEQSTLAKCAFGLIGGVSTASWLIALALGVSKVLAQSGPALFVMLVPLSYLISVVLSLSLIFGASLQAPEKDFALRMGR